MSQEIIDLLFGDAGVLFYEGLFKDKPFTKQWTRVERADDTGYRIGLYLEVDPKPLGQGGAIFRERCWLQLDPELKPVSYGSDAGGVRIALRIADDTAHVLMPDGSQIKVPAKDAQFIVEANMAGLDAVMFAVAHARGLLAVETQLQLFLLNKLLVVPYTVTPRGDHKLTTSYDEEIELDERGVLQSTNVPKAGVLIRKQDAPPLPEWHAETHGTKPLDLVRYLPPKDRTFELQDVSIATKRGEVGGTLTIPRGSGPFPAVLFLSGTGQHDRHGIAGNVDLGSHEIIDYLSEHGLVGLRFDTRGAGTTKLGDLDSGLDPLLEHGEAWFRYLTNRPEVDPKRVALIGHSQGGTVALILATDGRVEPSAIVLLATPGRTLDAVLIDQIEWQVRELGMSEEQRAKNVADFRGLIAAVKAGKSFEAGAVPDYLVASARSVAWFKDHLEIDPADLVAKLCCRVLVAQGELDFQVPRADADRLFEAARKAGLDAEFATFANLDHLFKPCPDKSTLELYYDTTRRVDSGFLERLLTWLGR